MSYGQRNMTSHMLTPLRHFYQGAHLITHAAVDATEAGYQEYGAIPAGRCLHLVPNSTAVGELPLAKLGCVGNNKIPVFIFRDSDSYSGAGFEGPDSAVVNGPSWATGFGANSSEARLLMFVGLEGYELATTEFDKTQRPYQVGDYLKAPELNLGSGTVQADARNIAGVLTNDTVVNGTATIVGIVSSGVPTDMGKTPDENAYGEQVLTFYTTYRPPAGA